MLYKIYLELSSNIENKTKSFIKSIPENKRNLSTSKLLINTSLIKEATTPKITYKSNKIDKEINKEKEERSFIEKGNLVQF